MAAATAIATVDVDCPRCDSAITCHVVGTPQKPKPGATTKVSMRITDLADRLAEHYVAAGHTTPANPANKASE
jgi:hypothetical protein